MDADFWKGFYIGQSLKPILWRMREPIGYLYGHVAKEGETPTHIINGVNYVGAVLPKLPTPTDTVEYPFAHITKMTLSTGLVSLYFSTGKMYRLNSKSYLALRPQTTLLSGDVYGARSWSFSLDNGVWSPDRMTNPTVFLESDPDKHLNHRWSELLWSNHDIYDEDGNLYFAKSDPIPIYSEPVAYLYNGVRLPDIRMVYTDERAEQFPYAFISKYSDDYKLYAFSYKQVHSSPYYDEGGGIYISSAGKEAHLDSELSQWVFWWGTGGLSGITTERADGTVATEIVWANYDILNKDGSVYLAASDPIPVYEGSVTT